MCMRGLEDGIRVLATYGLAFLSGVPAVGTGTMGSLLQTGKLVNTFEVKCFYRFKYSVPLLRPNLPYPAHTLKYLHQSATKMMFSAGF